MTRNWLRHNIIGCIAAIILTTIAACRVNDSSDTAPTTDATKVPEELRTLPSLEDTNEKLTSSIQQLGTKISAIVPAVSWKWQDQPQGIGCSKPYEQSDGKVILLPFYVSSVAIPESSWHEALAAAKETAASIDIPNLGVIHDAPNNHDVRFSNETGTAIALTSQAHTVISGYTGCRIPATNRSNLTDPLQTKMPSTNP